jgi:hypothetical protein
VAVSDERLIRIENLRTLCSQRSWGPTDLARELGNRSSYWSDVLRGTKSFGEKASHAAEDKLGLPRGALDQSDLYKRHTSGGGRQAHSLSQSASDDVTDPRTIEDAYRNGRGWFDEDGISVLTPQEVHMVGIFRQLTATARKLTLQRAQETLDQQDEVAETLDRARRPPSPHSPRGRSGFGELDEAPAQPATKRRAR